MTPERRERKNAQLKEWRAANKEKVQGYNADWTAKRKIEDPRLQLLRNARYRAAQKGLPCTIVLEDIVIPKFCPVFPWLELKRGPTRRPYDFSPSLDRIIPSLGYVPGNVQVISNRANRFKSDATVEEVRLLLAHMEQTNGTDHGGVTTH
ncbi:hypothetical protein [Rhizobium sp. LEGMi166a]